MAWRQILVLNNKRKLMEGSVESLAAAAKCGAEIKSYTTFDYAEHMAAPDIHEGLVQEMMSFAVAYWLEGGHVAVIQTTRYPAAASLGFGDAKSLSFFLNNDNGRNSIARPFLDGTKGQVKDTSQTPSENVPDPHHGKYKTFDSYDSETSSPCENFTYDFGEYRWWVDESWQEMLSVDAQGNVISGSLDALQEAFRAGRSLKVGVKNLCSDLVLEGKQAIEHEVFVELHSIYNHHDAGYLGGESQPVVRVAPDVPLRYEHGNWNFGWILPRTDGIVHQLIIDPHTRSFTKKECRFASRWFAQ